MWEKRQRNFFWKVSYSRCFLPFMCKPRPWHLCQRKNFLFLPYSSSPNQPDCLSIYRQPDSEQIFIFLYSKDFQGEKMGNRTKNFICKEKYLWKIHDSLHCWGWNAQKLSQTHPARLFLGSEVLLRDLCYGICQTLSSLMKLPWLHKATLAASKTTKLWV